MALPGASTAESGLTVNAVSAGGCGRTVIVALAVRVLVVKPVPLPTAVTVIVAVPTATAVTTPAPLTLATVGVEDAYEYVTFTAPPARSGVGVSEPELPTASVSAVGASETLRSASGVGGGGIVGALSPPPQAARTSANVRAVVQGRRRGRRVECMKLRARERVTSRPALTSTQQILLLDALECVWRAHVSDVSDGFGSERVPC